MSDTDTALLAAVCEGSERAFSTLIDRHQQAVRTFLRRLALSGEADDIAQETFLALWREARSFRGQASVRSWLFSIAWNKAKDNQRSWYRRWQRDTNYLAINDQQSTDAGSELQVAMDKALAGLSLPQRACVMLCLAHGFTHAEAAAVLKMPLGTVKSHVARGREHLQEELGENW
jgi:RNA polymerase sigma-70 factor (ECF subfamily)